jgi:superoxide dismutase, Fe-Mn family
MELPRTFAEITRDLPDSYELPPLPYSSDALEPEISQQIMELHHGEHHKGYVDGYNEYKNKLRTKVISKDPGCEDGKFLLFHLGGHLNHSMFWNCLSPHMETKRSERLQALIDAKFKGVDGLKEEVLKCMKGIRGSGWIWLCYDEESQSLILTITENQSFPMCDTKIPILNIDMWEHAYYLQYTTKKATYLEALWKIINWSYVSQRLELARR